MKIVVYSMLCWVLVFFWGPCHAQKVTDTYPYAVPDRPWAESFGNHRAVLKVKNAAQMVSLSYKWRRADLDVANRRFLIIHAETGDTVQNVLRQEVNNEACNLIFGPVKESGTYYFYYLPYQVQKGHGGFSNDYLKKEKAPNEQWVNQLPKNNKIAKAEVLRVESRMHFDSFFPMELAATAQEKKIFRKKHGDGFLLFPEDRRNPIRMKKEIPYKWIQQGKVTKFKGKAQPNEYYAFQIGIWSGNEKLEDIEYKASEFVNGKNSIPASAITCFNKNGINPDGQAFVKKIQVNAHDIQPLWFGVDISKNQPLGKYQGIIEISNGKGKSERVAIEIEVAGDAIADRGDNEPWRHSRLRWLNSTLGINDEPTTGYKEVTWDHNTASVLGRTIQIDEKSGLPESIHSWGKKLLSDPVSFIIQTASGVKKLSGQPQFSKTGAGKIFGSWKAEDDDLNVSCQVTIEFDGWVNYVYSIHTKKDIAVHDIRLEISMTRESSPYFMGMGLPGQDTPNSFEGKWDGAQKTVNNYGVSIPVSKKNQSLWPFDSFWMGSAKGGIHCELRGTTYSGPLLNLYRPAPPMSWYNDGKGGFNLEKKKDHTLATVYSGARLLKANDTLNFDFALLITPVKSIDYRSQFMDRYYHNGSKPTPTDSDLKAGVSIINVHHANELNPFINYPFLTADKMKKFADKWHQKGAKVKIYYTVRELTNVAPEIWALRSLGDEIFQNGNGGGYTWCREHLIDGYIPQWYHHLENDSLGVVADASILTSGMSRWYNYYIEGLAWLVKHTDIDGIYLDDVAFDRSILKRMRRAMDGVKPGCIIDLHSNTGFSKGPAIQYAEFFPYVDKLWFGESFMYNQMSPANWLVESSGIPFGLMGDMLHGGGNQWLGMQYGMTVRHPWLTEGVICDPRVIWQIWDTFGIQDSKMVGFWEENPAVVASDAKVKVTAYIKEGKTLLSLGNYSDDNQGVILTIDWKALGLNPQKVKVEAPAIPTFQEAKVFSPKSIISVPARKGWLLLLSEK